MKEQSKTPAFLINTMIVLYFLYILLFNHITNEMRINLAGTILISQAFSTIYSLIFRMNKGGFLLVIILVFFILFSTIYPIIFQTHGGCDYASMARIILSLFFAIHIVCFPDKINNKLLMFLSFGTLLFVLFWVIANPNIIFVGSSRIAPFTAGTITVQGSSFIVVLCVIILHQLFVKKEIKPLLFYAILIPSFVVAYLYKVSSVYLLIGFYFGGFLFLKTKNVAYRILMILLGLVFIFTVLIHHEIRDGHSITNLATFGNGRIMAYLERADLLVSRDIPSIVFGTGPGTDIIKSYTWLAMKAGHSDFLAIITEFGIVGFVLMLFFFSMIIKRINIKLSIPLFASLFVSSLITVGMFYSPAIFPFFWMAIGLAMQSKEVANQTVPKIS